MPPATLQDDPIHDDLTVAFKVLPDDVDIVEATLLDG